MENKVKVNLADAPWTECECGCKVFVPALMFKKLSVIMSPTGKEEAVPVEVVMCNECKRIPAFLNIPGLPDDLKAVSKISISKE